MYLPVTHRVSQGIEVARDHLGLFDTPPRRQDVRSGLLVAAFFFVSLVAAFPFRDIRSEPVVAFIPTIDAVMFTAELIVATLLFAQASIFRSRALTALASGYVFTALLLIPHALTFPGAFAPSGLFDAGVNTTAWTALFSRYSFPAAVILYGWLKIKDGAIEVNLERSPPNAMRWLSGAIVLAGLTMLLTVTSDDLLPAIFKDSQQVDMTNLMLANLVTITLIVVASLLLFRGRKSLLDMWLLVALFGWLMQSLLNIVVSGRFTVGFYCLFLMMMTATLIVMIALVAESNRLYARLAISSAKSHRDRETQSMSMSAVAAAIAHEVGQPLAAARLNATAGVDWLHHKPRRYDKAESSMQATIDAIGRVFDVIRSIRATFASGSGPRNDFSLSGLAEETVTLLSAELAAHKVSVQLDLDEALPPVLGNRIQIQRVLVNLLTNAIDSVSATKRRRRRICVRTRVADDEAAVLEVEDNGTGIGIDDQAQIFEPFYTTKSAGMGLGLSLSRSIVEEHGGRLWVSGGHGEGATFHMQLPQVSPALLLAGSGSGSKSSGISPMEERLTAA